MVSKSEFLNYVKKIIKEKDTNKDSKYLSKEYEQNSVKIAILGSVCLLAGFNLLSMLPLLGFFLLLFSIPFIVYSIIMAVKCNNVKKHYKSNYREKVIQFLLKDRDYSFNEIDYIDEKTFKDSQFGGYYEDYKGSDRFSINVSNDDGSKSNHYLTLCDLDVTKTETDSDGDRKTVTVYKGVFGYIYFPMEFKCLLCLNTKYKKRSIKLEKVVLEDINFNKKFKVYSDNQIESRYILTPSIMEKLLYLTSKLGRVEITLVDSKMYMGFEHVNLFELKAISNDNIETVFENLYDEIEVILKIVEEIKNNNKIFKI